MGRHFYLALERFLDLLFEVCFLFSKWRRLFFVPVQQNSVREFTVLAVLDLELEQIIQALVYTSSATKKQILYKVRELVII